MYIESIYKKTNGFMLLKMGRKSQLTEEISPLHQKETQLNLIVFLMPYMELQEKMDTYKVI